VTVSAECTLPISGRGPGTYVEQGSSTEGRVDRPGEIEWQPPPVVYGVDGSLFLNLDSMRVGRFYPVQLGGDDLVAVKEVDNSISLYAAKD
jgi:hypothetical protein